MEITHATLPSGLRLVHRWWSGSVEYFGVAIDAGSRDEKSGDEGLAHFVEHTLFKGTRRRKAWHVINRMEAVGGELNAYTTKEETMVYAVSPAGHMPRAAELISDLLGGAVFPAAELDLEREVIIDEINSYLDTPSENVFDEFEDMVFKGNPLGHNILGSEQTVKRFTTADCLRWLETFYTPSRMVVFYAGPARFSQFMSTAKRYFGYLRPDRSDAPSRQRPQSMSPAAETRHTGCHQAHTVMGAEIPGLYSPERYAISLLNNVLGGPGMNSLLNVGMRERRGLVYAVDSSSNYYTDTGLLTVYYGCDPADDSRCLRLADSILRKLSAGDFTPRRVAAAKRQYQGQLIVASENREQLALATARATLRGLTVKTVAETVEIVESISPEAIVDACRFFDPSRFSRLTIN